MAFSHLLIWLQKSLRVSQLHVVLESLWVWGQVRLNIFLEVENEALINFIFVDFIVVFWSLRYLSLLLLRLHIQTAASKPEGSLFEKVVIINKGLFIDEGFIVLTTLNDRVLIDAYVVHVMVYLEQFIIVLIIGYLSYYWKFVLILVLFFCFLFGLNLGHFLEALAKLGLLNFSFFFIWLLWLYLFLLLCFLCFR